MHFVKRKLESLKEIDTAQTERAQARVAILIEALRWAIWANAQLAGSINRPFLPVARKSKNALVVLIHKMVAKTAKNPFL